MRKEVTFAIFFGAAFGLIIAFGVWRLNASLSERGQENKTEATPTPTAQNDTLGLTIAKPADFSVVRESKISIEGATKAGSWLVISGEVSDNIQEVNAEGGFRTDFDLAPGLNQVNFSIFDKDNTNFQKTLSLVYSSQFPTASGDEPKKSTDSASVKEDVKEKIDEVQNAPTSYIGTVTDIAETTLHIKNTLDELKQASTETTTTFSNEITKKEIKLSDIAIGDFVIAMGYKNGNQVLHAKRVVVSKKPAKSPQTISYGVVKQIKNKLITLSTKGGEVELVFPKSWKGPDIDEIAVDSKVIVVSVTIDGKNTIRTIAAIPN